MDDEALRRGLIARIDARRADLRFFLSRQRPRIRRLATATIVLTSLAAVFTAGPAVGGENFSGAVQKALGLRSDSYVWRVLCLAALLVSVAAALMTNIGRSPEAVARLSAVEAANVELEGLRTLLQFGHLSLDDAVKLYQQYTVPIAFVEEAHPVVDAVAPNIASGPAQA